MNSTDPVNNSNIHGLRPAKFWLLFKHRRETSITRKLVLEDNSYFTFPISLLTFLVSLHECFWDRHYDRKLELKLFSLTAPEYLFH